MTEPPLRMQVYVAARTLAGVGIALGVISSVVMLIEFVELSRTLGGRLDMNFIDLIGVTGLKSPAVILLLLPFVFLFGTMGAFVALNRGSELVAMRAAGVSAWRFTLPSAIAAFLLGVLTICVLNPAASALNEQFEDRRLALTEGHLRHDSEIWLRQGDDREQIVIHARSHETIHDVVHLHNVSLFIQSVAPNGEMGVSRRIEATEARLTPGFWRLRDAREALPGADLIHAEQLSIPSMMDHRSAMERVVSPQTVAFWGLPAAIRSAELAGYSATAYRLRLQQLLATPLLFSAMTVLAAAFSLRLMRLGDLASLAGAGVGLGFLVFFLNELCGALGGAEVIPAAVAAWAPPLLALLAGITLLIYTEDG